MNVREKLDKARLYLVISTAVCRRPILETLRIALEGGVQAVQLREKEMSDREYLDLAKRAGEMARRADALFYVNDRVHVAQVAPCDGVHLGQDDLPLDDARRILGEETLLGLSTHTREQVRVAERLGADYIGTGPVFETRTKETGTTPIGVALAAEAGWTFPGVAYAIGGINGENLAGLMAAGVHRAAVSSAICGADDPLEVAARMRALLERAA